MTDPKKRQQVWFMKDFMKPFNAAYEVERKKHKKLEEVYYLTDFLKELMAIGRKKKGF
jgi:hypothetical protein